MTKPRKYGNRHKHSPAARHLRTTVIVDDAEFERSRNLLGPIVATIDGLGAVAACPHLFGLARAGRRIEAHVCTEHPLMRCKPCMAQHTAPDVLHDHECIADDCDQLGIAVVEVVFEFHDVPIFSMEHELELDGAAGSRTHLAPVCGPHSGRRFIWGTAIAPRDPELSE